MTKKLIDLGWDKESDELVDLGFGSPATKQSTGATGDFTSTPGLPGMQEIEQRISQRPDMLGGVVQDVFGGKVNPLQGQTIPIRTAGGIMQRGEAAVANPLMAFQQGRPGEAFEEFISGVSGQKSGELGDLYRSMGIPETESSILGMVSLTGVLKGVSQATKFISNRTPKLMTGNWIKGKFKDLHKGILSAKKEASDVYSKIYQRVGTNNIPSREVEISFNKLPKIVKGEFFKGQQVGRLTKGKGIDVNTVKTIRDQLNTEIGEGTFTRIWEGKGIKVSKQQLIDLSRDLKNIILDNVDDVAKKSIKAIDPVWTDLSRKGTNVIRRIYDAKTGTYKTNSLMQQLKDPNFAGQNEVLEDLGKYTDEVTKFIKSAGKYVFRQKAKHALGTVARRGAAIAAVGGAGALGLRKIIK